MPNGERYVTRHEFNAALAGLEDHITNRSPGSGSASRAAPRHRRSSWSGSCRRPAMRFILVSALAVVPAVAWPQPADSFHQLEELLDPEVDIAVTYDSGEVVRGRAVEISPSALTLMTADGRLELDEVTVRCIRQRWHDSTWDGAIIGFALGSAPWWLLTLGSDYSAPNGGAVLTGAVMFTTLSGVAGMLIGATMDAGRMRERKIYRAPERRRPHAALGPLLSRDRLGAAVRVAW